MPVDEIGRAAEPVHEHADLIGDFDGEQFRFEPMLGGAREQRRQRQESARAQRRKACAQRRKRRSQRHVQTDGEAPFAGIEARQRERLRAVKARRRHHHRDPVRGNRRRGDHRLCNRRRHG